MKTIKYTATTKKEKGNPFTFSFDGEITITENDSKSEIISRIKEIVNEELGACKVGVENIKVKVFA